MKKNKKVFLIGLIATAPLAVGSSLAIAFHNKNNGIYFDNRIFQDENEALKYLVQGNKIKVEEKKVLGDLQRSYINSSTGQLNKNYLPDYDVSKFKFAYFNAGGGITKDYESAKRSKFNPALVVHRYVDGFTDRTFGTEVAAQNSIDRHRLKTSLGYYNVDYIENPKSGNYIKVQKKLNSFSEADVKKYMDNIQENIVPIILDNLKFESRENNNNQRNGDNLRKLGYDIRIIDKNLQNNDLPKINISKIIDQKIANLTHGDNHFKYINNSQTKKIEYSINSNVVSRLHGDWVYTGHMEWGETQHFTYMDAGNINLKYKIKEWTADTRGGSFIWKDSNSLIGKKLNSDDFITLINGGGKKYTQIHLIR